LKYIKTGVIAIALIAFTVFGIDNIVNTNHKVQLREIELKSYQAKLLDLNNKYDQVLDKKARTEKEKEQQSNKIKKLEAEKKRLQADLQAKAGRKAQEDRRLAVASEKALGEQSVSAASGDCASWMAQAGVPNSSASNELIRRESNCNPRAVNPSSGACGIAQDINGCTVGYNPVAQLKWMQNYIVSRYGSWESALAHHNRTNWY